MSRLLDKLEQISKGNSKPMGFAAMAAKSKLAGMVIIAAVDDNDKAAAAAEEYADAVLLKSLAVKNAASKDGLPWGAPAGEPSEIKGSGCDFILIDTDKSPIDLLQEEKLCRIIEIDPALSDGQIRAAGQLPVDIVLIAGGEAISMKRLLTCQHIANLVGRYLMVRVPPDISAAELREIWEIGIMGIIVPVKGDARKELSALRQAVDALPASRRKRGPRASATLPSIAPPAASPDEYEEPDEDE